MKQPVLYLSRADFKAVKKFRRLTARLRGMIQDESYYQISLQERNSFLKKLKTLFKRVTGLQHRVGLKLAGATFAMLLLAGNLSAQKFTDVTGTPGDPFFVAENPLKYIEPAIELNVGNDEPKPALVDIDNDGDLDLFVANQDSEIMFFKNTGSKSAPMFELIEGSKNPANNIYLNHSGSVAFADLDKDGDQDMFVAEKYSSLRYYKNVGTASNAQFSYDSCGNPLSSGFDSYFHNLAFADIDNDGDQDLFGGGYYGNIKFWQNISSGTSVQFTGAVSSPFGLSGYRRATPAFVDMDNDTDLDAVIGDSYGNLTYFKNVGSKSAACFSQGGTESPFGDVDLDNTAPIFADLDNDTDFDLLLGWNANKSDEGLITFVPNTGTKSLPKFEVPSNDEIVPLARLADVDNDGDNDALLVVNEQIAFFKNTGTKSSPKLEEQPTSSNPFASIDPNDWIPNFIDIDGDGDLDLLVGSSYSFPGPQKLTIEPDPTPHPALYKNLLKESSQLAFTLVTATDSPIASITIPYPPEFADIDSDGDLDAITGDGYNLLYFKNTGTSSAPIFSNQGTGTANPFTNVDPDIMGAFFADIDNDGDEEMFVNPSSKGPKSAPYFPDIMMYEKVGDTYELADAEDNPLSGFAYGFVSSFADMDDDGDFDTFFGKYDNLKYVKNSGTALLARMEEAPASFGNYIGIPSFADMDKDGDLEIFSGGMYQLALPFFKYEQESGKGRYFAKKGANNPFSEWGPTELFLQDFTDVDGDGYPDMVFSGDFGESNPAKGEITEPDALRYFKNMSNASDGIIFEEVSGTANPFSELDLSFPGYTRPVFVDMDNDGDQDMVTTFVPFNDKKKTATEIWKPVGLEFNHSLAGCCGPMIQYFENNEGAYEERFIEDTPFADLADFYYPLFGLDFSDIDADGDLDVFAISPNYYSAGPSTNFIYFENLANDGIEGLLPRSGNLNPLISATDGMNVFSAAFVDYEGDGDEDVLLCGQGYSDTPYKFVRNDNVPNIVKQVADRNGMLQVYPNPVNGQIKFLYRIESADNVQITVLDLTGKSLISQSFDRLQKGEQVSIESESLASGMYLLQLNAGGKSYQTKFMKQ